jgi:hypothetical protein
MHNTLRQKSGKYNLEIRYTSPRRLEIIDAARRDNCVSCVFPVFGGLTINEDGKTGRIASQVARWGGHINDERKDSRDLHLVFYLPASLVAHLTNPKDPEYIIRFGLG